MIAERLCELATQAKVVVIVDEHTGEICYPLIGGDDLDVFVVPIGEEAKQLEVVQFLWNSLMDFQYGRADYLVSLGGGAVSDLAGFVASTYMRGMHLVHIPTTLLGMIDASIGGKTAIDYYSVKNMVGTFYEPDEVWVSLEFLATLPSEELQSGLGELLKYELLIGEELCPPTLDIEFLDAEVIAQVIQYKLDVVADDFRDKGGRMVLNLGHTTAHGLEGLALSKGQPLKHGIAVVAGLVVALYISYKWHHMPETVLTSFARKVKQLLPKIYFDCDDYDAIWGYAVKDKKNVNRGELTMVLLESLGCPIVRQVKETQWREALDFYRDYMY